MQKHFRPSIHTLGLVLCCLIIGCQDERAPAKTGVIFQKQSEFNHVVVSQDRTGYRSMTFSVDGAIQSAQDVNRPDELVISYTRATMLGPALHPNPKRMLMVGLGGGSMPRFLRKQFPEAHIDVAELDPVVFDVAREYFGFKEDERMKVHIGDGRAFIEKTDNRYDIIFLDAYGIDYIPYSLATREFLQAVKAKLTADGIVVANVWSGNENALYDSMVKTYRDVFPGLSIIQAPASENCILIATQTEGTISKERWLELARAFQKDRKLGFDLAPMVETGYLHPKPLNPRAKVLLDADAKE